MLLRFLGFLLFNFPGPHPFEQYHNRCGKGACVRERNNSRAEIPSLVMYEYCMSIFAQPNNLMAQASDPDLLSRSSLYRALLVEREEILKHKWLESQKAGRDIGFENALVNWVIHHRARWRRERRQGL